MPYSLLLADDSVTIQRVIELTFADEDIHVVAVSDGDQAIERLEAAPPDIVLADVGMPGKNGYEVARYIRQSPLLSHIPVVLLTGAFEPVDQARAAEAGCDGVLAKPFEPQLVIGRVKELLARSGRSPQSVDAFTQAPGSTAQWGTPTSGSSFQSSAPGFSDAGPDGLNDYFDRLDAAFSALTPSDTPAPLSPPPPVPPAAPPVLGESNIDWFGSTSDASAPPEGWDLPAAPASFEAIPPPAAAAPIAAVQPPVASVAPQVAAVAPPVAPVAPATPMAAALPPVEPPAVLPAEMTAAAPAPAFVAAEMPADVPPLADAFSALLAAEEGDPEAAAVAAAAWPPAPAAAVAGHELVVDDITRRVLERLSDQVLRDTVADIVSKVAEQLVRAEIEKIKASIK